MEALAAEYEALDLRLQLLSLAWPLIEVLFSQLAVAKRQQCDLF